MFPPLPSLNPVSLNLSASDSGLRIIKYWLKESTFIQPTGGGSVDVLNFYLKCIMGLDVKEEGIVKTGIGKAIASIKKCDAAKGGGEKAKVSYWQEDARGGR